MREDLKLRKQVPSFFYPLYIQDGYGKKNRKDSPYEKQSPPPQHYLQFIFTFINSI